MLFSTEAAIGLAGAPPPQPPAVGPPDWITWAQEFTQWAEWEIATLRNTLATITSTGGTERDRYAITNRTVARAFDANATTTAELADVLGTLIADLQGGDA